MDSQALWPVGGRVMTVPTIKNKPIIFNGDMVRALLDGHKTQTRRLCKLQPHTNGELTWWPDGKGTNTGTRGGAPGCYLDLCPFGKPGDLIWVRETFCPIYPQDQHYNGGRPIEYDFKATYQHGDRMGDLIGERKRWTPSIHMPRWASRFTLKITGVRVERLQDISEEDAVAEGAERGMLKTMGGELILSGGSHRCGFINLWQSIYGPRSWLQNPWVWVIEFEPIMKNIDDVIRGESHE